MVTSSVRSEQRHTKRSRCPICGGADGDQRGKGRRCHGFTSTDGYAHCAREEHAGGLPLEKKSSTYAHKLGGLCKCGTIHRDDESDWNGIEVAYDYRDERGALLQQVVRKVPKDFRQRKPDGAGGWIWSTSDVRRVPYRMPEVLKAPLDAFVFIVEGEKDVDRLRSLGAHATCNPGGAKKWGLVDPVARVRAVEDRHVVVIGDADPDGREHMEQVAADVCDHVATLRVFSLYSDDSKRDVSDWLDEGHTLAELVQIAESTELRAWRDVDPWKRELAVALEDVQGAIGSTTTADRTPLFGDATHLLTKEFPLATWAIVGMLTRLGVGVIGAEPKSIKTFIAIAMAVAVATGTPLFGEYQAAAGVVAYFFAEDLDKQVRNRLRAELAGSGVTLDPGRLHVCPRGKFLDVLRDEDLAWLVASARAIGKIDLLVLDPLRDLHSGEEDKSDSMRDVMRRLRLLGELLGCTVLFVHHTGKVSESTSKRRPGQRLRGSGAIHGSIDFGIYPSEAQGGDGKTVFVNNVVTEVKGARGAGLFGLELKVEDDANGEAVCSTWRVIKVDGADPLVNQDEAGELVSEIAAVMARAPGQKSTVRDLRKDPGGGKRELSAAIASMKRDGLIVPVFRGKLHNGYRLTAAGVEFAGPAQGGDRVPS